VIFAIWATGVAPDTVEVDCTKLQLRAAVIARAPRPQARDLKVLLIVLMVRSFSEDAVICPMHFTVALVLYMTTSLH
jgi:hypothetical protein